MNLTLDFNQNAITGSGKDAVGSFTISGSYKDDGNVTFIKKYPTHTVNYTGKITGNEMKGSWVISKENKGEFVLTIVK